jgi:hypothetical protein
MELKVLAKHLWTLEFGTDNLYSEICDLFDCVIQKIGQSELAKNVKEIEHQIKLINRYINWLIRDLKMEKMHKEVFLQKQFATLQLGKGK